MAFVLLRISAPLAHSGHVMRCAFSLLAACLLLSPALTKAVLKLVSYLS